MWRLGSEKCLWGLFCFPQNCYYYSQEVKDHWSLKYVEYSVLVEMLIAQPLLSIRCPFCLLYLKYVSILWRIMKALSWEKGSHEWQSNWNGTWGWLGSKHRWWANKLDISYRFFSLRPCDECHSILSPILHRGNTRLEYFWNMPLSERAHCLLQKSLMEYSFKAWNIWQSAPWFFGKTWWLQGTKRRCWSIRSTQMTNTMGVFYYSDCIRKDIRAFDSSF